MQVQWAGREQQSQESMDVCGASSFSSAQQQLMNGGVMDSFQLSELRGAADLKGGGVRGGDTDLTTYYSLDNMTASISSYLYRLH